jgi:hypothetical protein
MATAHWQQRILSFSYCQRCWPPDAASAAAAAILLRNPNVISVEKHAETPNLEGCACMQRYHLPLYCTAGGMLNSHRDRTQRQTLPRPVLSQSLRQTVSAQQVASS